MKHEWKKAEKQYYVPGGNPMLIKVPPFRFFTIRGQGDPNEKSFGDYIGVLYSLSYAIKMSPKNGFAPPDYFDYTVYPLEGIWDLAEEARVPGKGILDKRQLIFTLMIRQPDFVTEAFAREAIDRTKKKKYHPLLEKAGFETIEDSLCIQMMHTGKYDDEPASFSLMEDFCQLSGYRRASLTHREIYLSDFRKVAPEKLKTVLRFRVK